MPGEEIGLSHKHVPNAANVAKVSPSDVQSKSAVSKTANSSPQQCLKMLSWSINIAIIKKKHLIQKVLNDEEIDLISIQESDISHFDNIIHLNLVDTKLLSQIR